MSSNVSRMWPSSTGMRCSSTQQVNAPSKSFGPPIDRSLLRLHDFIVQPAVFIRRQSLGEALVDESFDYTMDYELWPRLSKGHQFLRLDPWIVAVDRHHSARKSYTMMDVGDADHERLAAMYGVKRGTLATLTRKVWKQSCLGSSAPASSAVPRTSRSCSMPSGILSCPAPGASAVRAAGVDGDRGAVAKRAWESYFPRRVLVVVKHAKYRCSQIDDHKTDERATLNLGPPHDGGHQVLIIPDDPHPVATHPGLRDQEAGTDREPR